MPLIVVRCVVVFLVFLSEPVTGQSIIKGRISAPREVKKFASMFSIQHEVKETNKAEHLIILIPLGLIFK